MLRLSNQQGKVKDFKTVHTKMQRGKAIDLNLNVTVRALSYLWRRSGYTFGTSNTPM